MAKNAACGSLLSLAIVTIKGCAIGVQSIPFWVRTGHARLRGPTPIAKRVQRTTLPQVNVDSGGILNSGKRPTLGFASEKKKRDGTSNGRRPGPVSWGRASNCGRASGSSGYSSLRISRYVRGRFFDEDFFISCRSFGRASAGERKWFRYGNVLRFWRTG